MKDKEIRDILAIFWTLKINARTNKLARSGPTEWMKKEKEEREAREARRSKRSMLK